jgi:hypothetical protein
MQLLTRLTVTALVVVVLTGLLVFACPGLFAAVGVDVGDLPEVIESVYRERSRGEAIDLARSALTARIRGKEAVARELIDGTITVAQAGSRVRELCAGDDGFPQALAMSVRGADHNERVCRHIIGWVEAVLAEQPSRAAEVSARLNAELAAHLRGRGPGARP